MSDIHPSIAQPSPDSGEAIFNADLSASFSDPNFLTFSKNVQSLTHFDIADVAHFLCVLHGMFPGIVDNAANKTTDNNSREWFTQSVDACAAERAFLTQLAVTAGPIHTLVGQDQSDAAVLSQRHALEMLSQSERQGCAVGAAIWFVEDWHAIRSFLNDMALRMDIKFDPTSLPSIGEGRSIAADICASKTVGRAFRFGAEQMAAQHNGLWQLLAARKLARSQEY